MIFTRITILGMRINPSGPQVPVQNEGDDRFPKWYPARRWTEIPGPLASSLSFLMITSFSIVPRPASWYLPQSGFWGQSLTWRVKASVIFFSIIPVPALVCVTIQFQMFLTSGTQWFVNRCTMARAVCPTVVWTNLWEGLAECVNAQIIFQLKKKKEVLYSFQTKQEPG